MKHIKIVDITKKVPFMGQEVEIRQLTVKGVKDLQNSLKSAKEINALDTLTMIFKATVIGAEDMKNEEFEAYPIKPLTELSNEILNFNGLGASDDKGNTLGK